MKILITGSCGFIGTNLCLQLLNNTNNIIYGVDNYTDNYNILFKKEKNEELKKYKNYHFYNENILGTTLIANIKPDIIIHLASIPGVRKSLQEPLYYIENNISAFVYLLEECKKHNIAVIIDEVQSFMRTKELFAFQYFNRDKHVDFVNIGKKDFKRYFFK